VLTKSDLCDDIGAKLTELESVALGVDVVVTSSLAMTVIPVYANTCEKAEP